jgi:hypothetical protein
MIPVRNAVQSSRIFTCFSTPFQRLVDGLVQRMGNFPGHAGRTEDAVSLEIHEIPEAGFDQGLCIG